MPPESSSSTRAETGIAPPTEFYSWKHYRCAYQLYTSAASAGDQTPLLLIHPIGVGLSRHFWDRFCCYWLQGQSQAIYNPDLLGCGESDMPHTAYAPLDWAEQLQHFIQTVVQKPVLLVVQGALLPVAISLVQLQANTPGSKDWIRGLVLAGPPAWALVSQGTPAWRHRTAWNLFDSPLGSAFYRYARRRKFLQSFSVRQLFAKVEDVDPSWLDMLEAGAANLESRHAVFSFLAGFWRQDYEAALKTLSRPIFVVFGNTASSIGRTGETETPDQRLASYLQLPNSQGVEVPGRNVLPYESTAEFVAAIAPFVESFTPIR